MARLVTFTNQRVLVVKMFFRVCCCYVGLALLHMLGGVVYGVSQHLFRVNKCFHVGKKQILIDCGMELAEIWRNELHRMALWLQQGGIRSHSPPRNSGVE